MGTVKRVLIVEDDAVVSEGLALILERYGIHATRVFSVRQARTVCENNAHVYDAVLLDANLGSPLDAVPFLKWFRGRGDIRPVIGISGSTDDNETLVAHGATVAISKLNYSGVIAALRSFFFPLS